MRALVVNLTRLGDLLQTQPVISALAAQKFQVELICLENFSAATVLLRNLHKVHALPGSSLRALTEHRWPDAVSALHKWKKNIGPLGPNDQIINLTASLASRLLTSFLCEQIPAKGFVLDPYGFGGYSNDWAVYLQAASARRGTSPLNLMDIFSRVAETGAIQKFSLASPPEDALSWAREQGKQVPRNALGLAAFQLGASNEQRRWPTAFFASLGKQLWQEKKLFPVLLGATSEKHLAEKYLQTNEAPALNLCGKTTLLQLGAILCQCDFLVTNDTGTMHLAAGLGIPVLALFLATAQPWDTGPYQPGSLCLEPDTDCHPCDFSIQCKKNTFCRQQITPETVYTCILNWQYKEKHDLTELSGVRIWESCPQKGWMNLISLSGHETDDRVCWLRIQQQAYRHFIDSTEQTPLSPLPLPQGKMTAEIFSRLERSSNLLSLLDKQIDIALSRPEKIFLDKVMASWKRIHSCWDKDEHFSVLGYLWNCHTQQHPELVDLQKLTKRYLQFITSLQGLFS